MEGMGYSSINAQGLTAPVYLASFLLCVTTAFFSDKVGRRGFFIAGYATLATVGYAILTTVKDEHKSGVRYLGVWFAVCGVFPCICLNVSLFSHSISWLQF